MPFATDGPRYDLWGAMILSNLLPLTHALSSCAIGVFNGTVQPVTLMKVVRSSLLMVSSFPVIDLFRQASPIQLALAVDTNPPLKPTSTIALTASTKYLDIRFMGISHI
jgi:hypothetical protein